MAMGRALCPDENLIVRQTWGFRFQDHLQHPSVADQPKKGRAQLKRSIFCLFVKQTLYTEYGHSLPWLQISDSMLPSWLFLEKFM